MENATATAESFRKSLELYLNHGTAEIVRAAIVEAFSKDGRDLHADVLRDLLVPIVLNNQMGAYVSFRFCRLHIWGGLSRSLTLPMRLVLVWFAGLDAISE